MKDEALQNTHILAFKAISKFMACLNNWTGETNQQIYLYNYLLDKTTFSHERCIIRHTDIFKEFVITNRGAILEKNKDAIISPVIEYSSKVKINIVDIMNSADQDTLEVIWKHILTLSALLDPTAEARKILKESSKKDDNSEKKLFNTLFDSIDQSIDPTSSNPMDSLSSMLNSGVVSELMKTLSQDNVDINSILGIAQKMLTTLSGEDTPPLDLSSLMSALQPPAKEDSTAILEDVSSHPPVTDDK